jgi:hypothetical protein
MVIGSLAGIPYIHKRVYYDEVEDKRNHRKGTLAAALGTGVLLMLLWVAGDEIYAGMGPWEAGVPDVISAGLVPTMVWLLLVAASYMLLRKKAMVSIEQAVRCIFTGLLASFLTLMAIGIWFRGPGMALMWPW